MAESPENITNPFPADRIIELTDITQLHAFEDVVAATIHPKMTQKQRMGWEARPKLTDLLKPPNFNGSLVDIELEPFANPYERLINASAEGWKLRGGNLKRTGTFGAETIPLFRGFLLTANARTTGKGVIGQVMAGLWYAPHAAKARHKNGTLHLNASVSLSPIKRYVTRPERDEEKFREIIKASRAIGFRIMSQHMRHPMIRPNNG